jgi:hypothetical protein
VKRGEPAQDVGKESANDAIEGIAREAKAEEEVEPQPREHELRRRSRECEPTLRPGRIAGHSFIVARIEDAVVEVGSLDAALGAVLWQTTLTTDTYLVGPMAADPSGDT